MSKKKKYILFDYIRISYDRKVPSLLKKDLLYSKIIYLFKHLSYKVKDKFLNLIRFILNYVGNIKKVN